MNALNRNHVQVKGKGDKVMLFAHGYGCDQKMWRFITPAFEEEYKIILFDHVGFGQADTSVYTLERYATLQSYAVDILEICEELDLKEVVFVGHSVSGMIGILAAILNPSLFSKLILICPSPRYIHDEGYIGGFSQENIEDLLKSLDSDYLNWAQTIAPMIMGNPDKPELGEELAQSFCQSNEQVAKDFARITFLSDNRDDLPNLKTESLILQCTDDVIAPLEVGLYMHRNLPGSKLVIMKATGHCPNLSAPEETIAVMKEYLG